MTTETQIHVGLDGIVAAATRLSSVDGKAGELIIAGFPLEDFAAKATFEKTTITRRDLKANDVLIDIAFVGICHSDIHTARDEWGAANYPLAPGHEIAGIVSEVGAQVSRYAVGDRVGVGCMVDSCRECVNCAAGEEQYCLKGNVGTYGGMLDGKPTDGGYSQKSSSTRSSFSASPRASTWTSPPRCCAPGSRCTRR